MPTDTPFIFHGVDKPSGVDVSKLSTRQEYNRVIGIIILQLADEHPDWRFHQLLQNIGVEPRELTDMFFEESKNTLNKLLENKVVQKFFVKEEVVVSLDEYKNRKK